MRRVKKSLRVIAENSNSPKRFYWRGNWLQVVSVIDKWCEINNWWDDRGELHFYVVLAHNFGVYELCLNEHGIWYLTRVFD